MEISKPTIPLLAAIALILPITLTVIYTVALGIALLIRWIIIRRRQLKAYKPLISIIQL